MATSTSRRITLYLAIAVGILAYAHYPSPELPEEILTMKNTGTYFHHSSNDGNSHRIFFRDLRGDGPAGKNLFLLHGFPLSSYDWHKVLPDLLEDFDRVVVPDQLGYGLSDKPLPHNYTIVEQADIMEELLNAVGMKDAHFFCHDTGLSVCLEMLVRFNSRHVADKAADGLIIHSFAFQNGGMFPKYVTPLPVQKITKLPVIRELVGYLFPRFLFDIVLSKSFGPNTKPDKKHLDVAHALVAYNDGIHALPRILDYLDQRVEHEDRWIGGMANTNIPVHYIYCPADPVNKEATFQHFLKRVPMATTYRMPEHIGHWGMLEDPVSTVNFYRTFMSGVRK